MFLHRIYNSTSIVSCFSNGFKILPHCISKGIIVLPSLFLQWIYNTTSIVSPMDVRVYYYPHCISRPFHIVSLNILCDFKASLIGKLEFLQSRLRDNRKVFNYNDFLLWFPSIRNIVGTAWVVMLITKANIWNRCEIRNQRLTLYLCTRSRPWLI